MKIVYEKKVFHLLGLVILISLYWCVPVAATENAGTEPEISVEGIPGPGQSAGETATENAGTEPEISVEGIPGPGQSAGETPESDSGRNEKAAEESDSGPGTAVLTPDEVSSGEALMEWLEIHKNTGGNVKLTEDVVLEGSYCYCPSRPGCPAVLVDVGDHSIAVAGEMEFLSDDHLTFRGQADDRSLFYVAEGGLLSLNGVTVEGGQPDDISQYVLWQEEGAGLILDNCRVQGGVHYAEMPFVLGTNAVCAIAEDGQTAEEVLPARMECNVNYQGRVQYHQPAAVLWDLAGTEKQQEERLRFAVRGSFSSMAFQQPPVCTVVYHDYPLTFKEVRAYESAGSYQFRGSYMKQEDGLPMAIAAEYSFDGENWFVYGEAEESTILEPQTFFIGITMEQWNTVGQPFLYIRLRGERDGVQYVSNVLRYTADNLENGVDQGGTRGGGTSIVNPPDVPKEPGSVPPEGGDTPEDSVSSEEEDAPEGSRPSEGGDTPEGNRPPEEGNAPEGSRPSEEGDTPEDSRPPEGGDTPEGSVSSEEGDVPEGSRPSEGEDAPEGSVSSEGGDAPEGSRPSEGGNAPEDSRPSEGGDTWRDKPSSGDGKPWEEGMSAGNENLSEEGMSAGNGNLSGDGMLTGNGNLSVGSSVPVKGELAFSGGSEEGETGESTKELVLSVYAENAGAPVEVHISAAGPQPFHNRVIAAAAGFAGLSVLGGGAVWFFRARNK